MQRRLPARFAPLVTTPLGRASVLIAVVAVVGTVGYAWLAPPEYTLFDAAYMTVIMLTTVGYGEGIDLQGDPRAKAFTLGLLIIGVGTFVYFYGALTRFFIEGSLDRIFERHRMKRAVARLDGHYIVCGCGPTGAHVIEELIGRKAPVVLIERDPDVARTAVERWHGEVPVVPGDATDDEVLVAAGVERASGLVACFSNDKDNLVVTFSARALNADLRIVCRGADERMGAKLRLAGANAVVSPNAIGGVRMATELVHPVAVSFLDRVLRDHPENLRVEGVTIEAGSDIDDLSLRDLRSERLEDVLVVALQAPNGDWQFNPDGSHRLSAGTSVVFIATPELRARFERLASAR